MSGGGTNHAIRPGFLCVRVCSLHPSVSRMAKKLMHAVPAGAEAGRPKPFLLKREMDQDRLCRLCASHNSPDRIGRGAAVPGLPSAPGHVPSAVGERREEVGGRQRSREWRWASGHSGSRGCGTCWLYHDRWVAWVPRTECCSTAIRLLCTPGQSVGCSKIGIHAGKGRGHKHSSPYPKTSGHIFMRL
jgi:hypothetical protein